MEDIARVQAHCVHADVSNIELSWCGDKAYRTRQRTSELKEKKRKIGGIGGTTAETRVSRLR
jgi:hypothetical protein